MCWRREGAEVLDVKYRISGTKYPQWETSVGGSGSGSGGDNLAMIQHQRLQSSPPAPSVSHSSGSDTERREERGEVSRTAGIVSENAHLLLYVEYD